MKKLLSLVMILLLIATAAVLTSCGEDAGSNVSGDNEVAGSLKINVKEDDGSKTVVGVDMDTDVDGYTIVRDENASSAVKEIVTNIRTVILDKTGASLKIKTSFVGVNKAIVISIDEEMGVDEYSLTAEKGRIYIKAGSEDSLSKITSVFTGSFIYGSKKALLVPAGKGYGCDIDYPFDKITVEGVDISEFEVYADPSILDDKVPYSIVEAVEDALNAKLLKAVGREVSETSTFIKGNNYVIINKVDFVDDVDAFSIKIENGNIYLEGSFVSLQAAAETIVTELIGYKEGMKESGKKVDLSNGTTLEGSANMTVPYTKAELLKMFEYAYENDEMLLTGTHTWGAGNGRDITYTEHCFESVGYDVPVILELDMASYSPLMPSNNGEDTLGDYALSWIVSEAKQHVSNGGVIAVCAHFVNPTLQFDDEERVYTGKIGGDAGVEEMITKGTPLNKAFHQSADTTIRLVKALNDNGIPFLLRPFHEMTGDWFWWGIARERMSAESFVDLWKYFYNEVTVVNGVTEALWVYAPSTNSTLTSYNVDIMYPYPGDEYIDIVGMDGYIGGASSPRYNENDGWDKLVATGKPVAFTEFGPDPSVTKKDSDGNQYYNYDCKEMIKDLKTLMKNGHKIAYFETWTWSIMIYLDYSEAVMEDPIIYTRSEMMSYWAND